MHPFEPYLKELRDAHATVAVGDWYYQVTTYNAYCLAEGLF